MSALLPAVLLGFVLGLQHATDPDHLVAVGTIVSRARRCRDGALVGALWGLGHTVTLGLAGAAVVLLGRPVPAGVAAGLELLVAAMLVGLGALRLRDALRGLSAVPAAHLLADHDHGGQEAFHSHAHDHGGARHAHPHLHPSPSLLAALGAEGRRLAARAVAVGAVHGLAGTAAVALLVLATLRTPAGALAYLAMFGLGSTAGMTVLTAVLAWPTAFALRFERARRALAAGAGLAAIAVGVVHAAAVL